MIIQEDNSKLRLVLKTVEKKIFFQKFYTKEKVIIDCIDKIKRIIYKIVICSKRIFKKGITFKFKTILNFLF